MPTAFAFDLAQLPEALRTHLKLWVEKTAARWAEEDSTLYFVRKKPTERRNIMRSLQTLAKGSWEIDLPTSNFLRDVDIVGSAMPVGNEPAVDESTGDDDEPESPKPLVERKSRPDLHRPLQNTAPAPTAPTVANRYVPEIYRSLLPPDYGEQVRRMMMIKAAA